MTTGPRQPDEPTDEPMRQRQVRQIKRAKIGIVVLVLLLLNGLRMFRAEPLFPQLVGITVNLCMIAGLVCLVVRLRKQMQG
jgi:hypothetical protein